MAHVVLNRWEAAWRGRILFERRRSMDDGLRTERRVAR